MVKRWLLPVPMQLVFALLPCYSQLPGEKSRGGDGWDRTREILRCAPRLVDHREVVEDNFKHLYFSTNPREVDDAYFSVEPVTYFEEGSRFCETGLPVAGVSDSYFRGTFETSYELPGEGVYEITLESSALIFNNDCRLINAQNAVATIEASHRLQLVAEPQKSEREASASHTEDRKAYTWELEFDGTGFWQGNLEVKEFEVEDEHIPSGISSIRFTREVRGPGVITFRESVLFCITSLSSCKFDPIFQAKCLFLLQPLSVTTRLLPCEE